MRQLVQIFPAVGRADSNEMSAQWQLSHFVIYKQYQSRNATLCELWPIRIENSKKSVFRMFASKTVVSGSSALLTNHFNIIYLSIVQRQNYCGGGELNVVNMKIDMALSGY